MSILETLNNLAHQTAFFSLSWGNYLMVAIACVFLFLAIRKGYEPLLLIPIAFGVLIANFPGGDMGVIQADPEGFVLLPDGTRESIWDMPLHKIAHDLGLMNYLYYALIKTGLLPPVIFLGVGALTDFGPMLRNLKLAIFGAAAGSMMPSSMRRHSSNEQNFPF